MQNNPDMVALIGASAALTLSGVPFMGPIAGARIGFVNGEYLLNPTAAELLDSNLELVVSGTHSSVLMVESEAQELSEEVMLGAVMFGHREMQPVINMIVELAETAAKDPWDFKKPDATALAQAGAGRLHILGEMEKALAAPRDSVGSTAPRITTMSIPKEKIREVIGSGGKVIREICEVTGAKVDIEDDGTVRIAATSTEAGKKAYDWIYSIVAEPEIGQIHSGKVVRVVDFGAFVNFFGAKDGLVHISELADYRVNKVEDIVKEGQTVKVKVMDIDNRGKIRLSMRVVDQETGADISDTVVSKEKRPA